MFAFNNEQVDYGLTAYINASLIKANLPSKPNVSVVCDEGTKSWLLASQGESVHAAIDNFIVVDTPEAQTRRFHDTLSTAHDLPWRNAGRSSAYTLSPYEETIMIDTDYLVMDETLDAAWGSEADVMMNRHAVTVDFKPVPAGEQRIEAFSIPMYWATCVYFRKSLEAKTLFDLVDLVREDMDYFRFLFKFPGKLFRNDYAFSAAAHIMGGFRDGGVPALPCRTIVTSFDTDEIVQVKSKSSLQLLVGDRSDRWSFTTMTTKKTNLHLMNKFSLTRHASALLEACR